MGLIGELKRSARPAVWAALEAAHPTMFWRRRHAWMLAHPKERELVLARLLCSPDATAVDVGASDGAYTIHLAARARRVVAFEAQPRQAARLEAMVKANALSVQVEPVALSDHCGSVTLRVPRGVLGGLATIEQTNVLDDLAGVEQIPVRTKRLDDYGLHAVGFIKIDVEGHELAVLRGGEETFRRCAPTLLVELEDRHHPHAVAEATSFLRGLGYLGFFLTDAGLQPIGQFDPTVHQAKPPTYPDYAETGRTYFNNFLFCTPQREPLLRACAARLDA
jgi:FkbM family methyltransferase